MTSLLSTALLAASILAFPAAAAEVQSPDIKPGPVMDAVQSALRELQAADDPRLPLPVRLDRMAGFRHTPETADKLRAVFGTDRPYTIERRPGKAKRLVYRTRLQPLHHTSAAGFTIDWDEGLLDLDMDKAGQAYTMNGRWNMLAGEDANMRVTARGMTLTGHQKRSPAGLWFGDVQLRIAGMRNEMKREGVALAMDDLRFGWRTVERPTTVDFHFQNRIGSIAAAGEKVEDVRFDMRFTNLDKDAIAELQAAGQSQRQQGATLTPEQRLAAMKPLFRSFGKAAITRGSALEIDEISARYHGNKATIRGRVGLVGAVEADLDDIKTLVKKIVASFEIRVPMAIVRDLAGAVAARQSAQQGAAPNGMSSAQLGQTMTDIMVGKLLGGGYARLEDDVLVSKLEFRNGTLTANGKEVGLPTPAPAGQPPVAAERSNLPPDALRARRIEESCRLPDFPQEVLDQDRPLRARFAWRVDSEGKVGNVRVAASSGYPAWDQAVVEGLGQCRYIPALLGGKPIGLQIDWNVVRDAGGPRSPSPAP
jgi:TonB family protein